MLNINDAPPPQALLIESRVFVHDLWPRANEVKIPKLACEPSRGPDAGRRCSPGYACAVRGRALQIGKHYANVSRYYYHPGFEGPLWH